MPTATPITGTRRNGTRGTANAEALLAAAHRLIGDRGENFTTQDLIKEADVALQTFYRHFGGKDQLLVAVVADLIAGHCESLAVRAATIEDPVERLHFVITDTLGTLHRSQGTGGSRFITSQHWRLHQILPDELAAAAKPFADLVQAELEAGLAAGVLAPRDPERDAWIINKLVMSVFHHYAFASNGPDVADVADVAEEVWGFCLAAVSSPPAPRKK